MIMSQGELARSFYIILSGKVQVFRQQDMQEEEVAVLGTGELLGEMSILRGTRRTASIRALTPVDLLAMDGDDFKALASSSTDFGELLDSVVQKRLSNRDGTKSP